MKFGKMRKMRRLSSRSVLRKCKKKDICLQDHFFRLPDEILVKILSQLTLKEAASTSILSRRWRYLWTFITGSLNFEAVETLYKLKYSSESLEIERSKFVDWVNHVLEMHQGNEIDQLRICFDLDFSYSGEVDSWVNFAIKKRVKRLELDFFPHSPLFIRCCYVFPSVQRLLSSSNAANVDATCGVMRNMSLSSFYSLTSLRLLFVHVTEEVLHYALANCPFLEQLSVIGSRCLGKLTVAGPSLKLKHLELYRCNPLENLEISDVNLVSFTYTGPKKKIPFDSVPSLSELTVGDEYCEFIISEYRHHSGYLSQLEKLKLFIPLKLVLRGLKWPPKCLKLRNLKHLELHVVLYCGEPLFIYTSLVKASPLLSTFILKLGLLPPLCQEFMDSFDFMGERQREASKCSHQCLRVVELAGFNGHQTCYELALHLLDIAVLLETITIDTRIPRMFYTKASDEYGEREGDAEGRESAQQLRANLPCGSKLVII